jgi:hypothetical protein
MLKWFLQSFPDASTRPDFLVKTDHDVFINIPNLVLHLSAVLASRTLSISDGVTSEESSSSYDESDSSFSEESHSTSPFWYYIGGQLHLDPPLDMDPTSKFYISPEFWFGKTTTKYPNYIAGPCYILSGNIVETLYNATFSVPLFPLEDVYLFGLVALQHLNLTLTNIPVVDTQITKTYKIIRSHVKLQKEISMHPMEPPELMYSVFNSVNEFMIPKEGTFSKKVHLVI